MARLEEAERGDHAAARRWLERAAVAPPDPAWVCDGCGAVATAWSADCGACGRFDSLTWRVPRHVGPLSLTQEGEVPRIAAPSEAPREPAATPEAPAEAVAAPPVVVASANAPASTPTNVKTHISGPAAPTLPALPEVAALPGPPDRVKPAPLPGNPAPPAAAEAASGPEEEDDEASAVEGYLPPRPR